jgi:hypothetical protein
MKKRLENINKSSVEIYTEPLDTEYKANKLHELMVNLLKEY